MKKDVNWEAIGVLTQVIGGVLVVVSLVYLAQEVRLNTKAVLSERREAHMDDWHELSNMVISDREVAEILVKTGDAEATLDASGKLRLEWLATKIFAVWESVYRDKTLGMFNQSDLAGWDQYFLDIISTRGLRDFWESHKGWYNSEFVEHVDRKLPVGELNGSDEASEK